MHDTEELTILPEGPQIASKTLEPIGILDQSRAWGLWIPHSEKDPAKRRTPELLVSAIPPASWPLAFQFQAYIAEDQASLRVLTEILKEANVDLLFAECGPAGHDHAALNAICVASGLEEALKDILLGVIGHKEEWKHASRQQLRDHLQLAPKETKYVVVRRLGLLMLTFLATLEAYLFDQHSRGSFLYRHGVDEGSGNNRQRFTRERAPWKLSPRYLLKDKACEYDHFLDCIIQADSSSTGPFAYDSRQFAKHIQDQTQWWLKEGKNKMTAAVPERDWGTAQELEKLESSEASDPFRFYRAWRHHTFDVIRLRALERLSCFWLFGENRFSPTAFRYDERQQVLCATDTSAFREAVDDLGEGRITLPARSVVSIDRLERFLRFCVFEQQQVEHRLVLIDLPYIAERPHEPPSVGDSTPNPAPASTRGFLHDLLAVIEATAVDSTLRRVSNRLIEQSETREQGTVRLLVEVQPDPAVVDPIKALEATASRLETAVRAFGERSSAQARLHLGADLRVSRYPIRRVFVSMIQDFERRNDVRRFLESLCRARGITAVVVGDDTETPAADGVFQGSISDRVLKEIRESDGFLQLLTLRTSEREALRRREVVHPNYGWLAYEYGVADERGLGPIRVVDQSMPLDVRRAFGVRQDNPDLSFDTEASDEQLRQQLDHAVHHVERWLYRRPPQATMFR